MIMNSWIGVLVLLAISIIAYGIVGYGISTAICFRINIVESIIWGFVYIMLVFQMINLFAEFQNWTLSSLSIVFLIAFIIMLIFSLISIMKERESLKIAVKEIRMQYVCYLLFVCVIGIQVLQIWTNGANGSLMDSSTYTGYAMAAVQTDRLNRTEPYSGLETGLYFLEAFISTDMHAATICKLTGMHPLIYIGRVLSAIEVVLYNICIFEVAKKVFKGDAKKSVVVVMFAFAINLGMGSIYTASSFMLYRGGEPKSMVANVGIPLMLYSLMRLVEKIDSKKIWMLVVFSEIVALSLSQSGWILIPGIITVILLYDVLKQRKYIINYIICMIPSFVTLFLMLKWRV